ncbi:MAG: hypothetical protein IE886_06060 [Campylobacterales bacterium]|nr:hypothetical protein [Campylobacterales bacterium]
MMMDEQVQLYKEDLALLPDKDAKMEYILDDEPDLVVEANLVFDPPWTMEKMSEEARLQLGMLSVHFQAHKCYTMPYEITRFSDRS